MEIDHVLHCSTLIIRQVRYTDDVVSRFNKQAAKVVINLCESGVKLSKMQSSTMDRNEMMSKRNRSLIGYLLYITTCTRPNITYVVTQLSRFLENLGQQHGKAAVRVLRILNTTVNYGIICNGSASEVPTTAYTAISTTDVQRQEQWC